MCASGREHMQRARCPWSTLLPALSLHCTPLLPVSRVKGMCAICLTPPTVFVIEGRAHWLSVAVSASKYLQGYPTPSTGAWNAHVSRYRGNRDAFFFYESDHGRVNADTDDEVSRITYTSTPVKSRPLRTSLFSASKPAQFPLQ